MMNFKKSIVFLIALLMIVGLGNKFQFSQDTMSISFKAYQMFTVQHWGCLTRQVIRDDISQLLARKDDSPACFAEIKNPEDVSSRLELFLVFPAAQVNRLPGSFVLIVWSTYARSSQKGSLSIDQAEVCKKGNNPWQIKLRVKGTGFIHAQMMYSRNPKIIKGWSYCEFGENPEPAPLRFFNAYPLEGEFTGLPGEKLSQHWQEIQLCFNPNFSSLALSIDKCQELLAKLVSRFVIVDDAMIWDLGKINSLSLKEHGFHVLLKIVGGTEIHTGANNFVPHLRQKMAVKLLDGTLAGAELLIRKE
jgi:hypothetical protein